MKCDNIQEKFSDYLEGALDVELSGQIRTHLDGCARCQGEMETLSQTKNAVKNLPEMEVPPGFTGRVMGRVREEKKTFGFWLRNYPAIKVMITVNAVALLLVGFLTVLLQRGEQSQDQLEIAQSFSTEAEQALDEVAMLDPALESSPEASAPSRLLMEEKPQVMDEVKNDDSGKKNETKIKIEEMPPESVSGLSRQIPEGKFQEEEGGIKEVEELFTALSLHDLEILFQSKDAGNQKNGFYKDLDLLLNEIGGEMLNGKEDSLGNRLDISESEKIVFLSIPEGQFERFKLKLNSIGKIVERTESPEPGTSLPLQKSSPSRTGEGFKPFSEGLSARSSKSTKIPPLRIKLIIQFPPNNPEK